MGLHSTFVNQSAVLLPCPIFLTNTRLSFVCDDYSIDPEPPTRPAVIGATEANQAPLGQSQPFGHRKAAIHRILTGEKATSC